MNIEAMVFDDKMRSEIDDTLDLIEFSPELTKKGFSPIWAILLVGPPGCGKTTLAKEIAKKLELEEVEKETSAIIDSHMGGTGSAFSRIFTDSKGKCLILNEFDSLGMDRGSKGSSAADKEQERTTASILQCMDRQKDKPTLLIATTNHLDKIDRAIQRRFSKTIEFDEPTFEMHKQLVSKMIDKHSFREDISEKIYKSSPSLAETKQRVEIFMIKSIIQKEKIKKIRKKKNEEEQRSIAFGEMKGMLGVELTRPL